MNLGEIVGIIELKSAVETREGQTAWIMMALQALLKAERERQEQLLETTT